MRLFLGRFHFPRFFFFDRGGAFDGCDVFPLCFVLESFNSSHHSSSPVGIASTDKRELEGSCVGVAVAWAIAFDLAFRWTATQNFCRRFISSLGNHTRTSLGRSQRRQCFLHGRHSLLPSQLANETVYTKVPKIENGRRHSEFLTPPTKER